MDARIRVTVSAADVDVGAEIDALSQGRADVGAVASFLGLCRDEAGSLTALELEHYPGMAEAEIARVAAAALSRWPGVTAIRVHHRHGRIAPGERIVLVAAASPHRAEAFAAAEYLMDFLKTSAPFWKKEHRRDGQPGDWVAAKSADEERLARWRSARTDGS